MKRTKPAKGITYNVEAELHNMKHQLAEVSKIANTNYNESLRMYQLWAIRVDRARKLKPANENSNMDLIEQLIEQANHFVELYSVQTLRLKERLDMLNENQQKVSLALSELTSTKSLQKLRETMNMSNSIEASPSSVMVIERDLEQLLHTAKALVELKTEVEYHG